MIFKNLRWIIFVVLLPFVMAEYAFSEPPKFQCSNPFKVYKLNSQVSVPAIYNIPSDLADPSHWCPSWTWISGPTGYSITQTTKNDTSGAINSRFIFTQGGTYVFKLTVTVCNLDVCQGNAKGYNTNNAANITFVVAKNEPPFAMASADPEPVVSKGDYKTTVDCYAEDDGIPENSELSYTWSGPSGVSFDNCHSKSTIARFSKTGYWDLTVTVSDGVATGKATVTVAVKRKIDVKAIVEEPSKKTLSAKTANPSVSFSLVGTVTGSYDQCTWTTDGGGTILKPSLLKTSAKCSEAGQCKFTLEVTGDNGLASGSAEASATVLAPSDGLGEGGDPNKPQPDEPNDPNAGKDNPAKKGDPVFLPTGTEVTHARDIFVQGRGIPFTIERIHRDTNEYNTQYGYGWDINWNMKLRRLSGNSAKVILLNGKLDQQEFTQDSEDQNIYTRPESPGEFIEYTDSNYVLVTRHGTEYEFDTIGNLSAIVDRNGNTISFTYDPCGLMPVYGSSEYFVASKYGGPANGRGVVAIVYHISEITDDAGRKYSFAYNSSGLLKSITDYADRTWQYKYDSRTNDLISVTSPSTDEDPNGLATTYKYDTEHRLLKITDANNNTWLENTYQSGKVKYQKWGTGTYTFNYYPDEKYATVVNRNQIESDTAYNSNGQITEETTYTAAFRNSDPDFYRTRYEYDSEGLLEREIFPGGNYNDYTYDDHGNITLIAQEPNDSTANIETSFTYNENFNFVETITDPYGKVITCDYNDTNGNLEKITYPQVDIPGRTANPQITFKYNSYGQIEEVTSPDNIVTHLEYYDANNFYKVKRVIRDYGANANCLNIVTEYDYDLYGNLIQKKLLDNESTQEPNDYVPFTRNYNELNQLVQSFTSSGATNYGYNKAKMLYRIENEIAGPNQIAVYGYNLLDQIKAVTNPLGNISKIGYDAGERLTSETDAENNQTQYAYDERDLLWKTTDAKDYITEYSYTLNGELASITDANGNITTYTYDGFDRLERITYPNSSYEEFTYDKNGNICTMRTRNGDNIAYTYDALNRLKIQTLPGNKVTTYLYDIAGRLVEVDDDGSITQYGYDRIGRLVSTVDPDMKTVGYEYDHAKRTKLVYPDNTYITYKYDFTGRLTEINDQYGSLAKYRYDELGRRTYLTYGNDANAVYEYDIADQLTGIRNRFNADRTQTIDYTIYDKVGNRKNMVVDTNTSSYTYDQVYQLVFADYPSLWNLADTHYYYDKLGSRTSVFDGATTYYTHNRLNQYGSVGGITYSYDINGNIANDGVYKYNYDIESRLISVYTVGDVFVASYTYDYYGRRVSKTVGTVTTDYVYDGDDLIAEYDSTGMLLKKYIYGPGIDEPVCMIIASGASAGTYYYHYDGLGSVVALTDSSGTVVERYNYDVFGTPDVVSTLGNRFMFTGREYDAESGLYYYRARAYNPEIGRFLQPDPIGYYDSMNLYQYCLNNPVNFIDPFGTDVWIGSRGLHRNINVGNPNGEYRSFSFGLNSRWDILKGPWRKGEVYEDDTGAKMVPDKSIKTTKSQDEEALEILDNMVGQQTGYDLLFGGNCRGFSNDMFDILKERYGESK